MNAVDVPGASVDQTLVDIAESPSVEGSAAAVATPATTPRRLLIVDDQPSVCAALEFVFAGLGCAVRLAASGAEALALTEMFDAALVDFYMPGMSGEATCRALRDRAMQQGRGLPVWIMTAAPTSELAAKCREAGAEGVLRKPFDCEEVIRLIETRLTQPLPPQVSAA